MDPAFEKDWRRRQELEHQPLIDAVYRKVLNPTFVQRSPGSDMDREDAIDTVIGLTTGQKLTIQEKCLSRAYAEYNTVTIEYWQNPATGEQGDWFRILADLYFISYLTWNRHQLEKWAILDVPLLKIATASGQIPWCERPNKQDGARATFRYVDVRNLPERIILWQEGFL